MNDLIEALKIFAKYTDSKYPTGCEHDTLYVFVKPGKVSREDFIRLFQLGFIPCDVEEPEGFKESEDPEEWLKQEGLEDSPSFHSYRFGSA